MNNKLVFIVEGKSEVQFVEDKLIPYLYSKGIALGWSLRAQTINTNVKQQKKGGVGSYQKFKNDLIRTAHNDESVFVTTLVDFFRLPSDFPCFTDNSNMINEIESAIRNDLEDDIPSNHFFPYIQRHEFEALMFANVDGFRMVVDDERQIEELSVIVNSYKNPEDINGGPDTAPSKRLSNIFPYNKVLHGEFIMGEISVDEIRSRCPRFDMWIENIEFVLKNGFFN